MVFGCGDLVCVIQTFCSTSTNCVIPLPMVAPLPPSIPLRSLRSLRLKNLRRQRQPRTSRSDGLSAFKRFLEASAAKHAHRLFLCVLCVLCVLCDLIFFGGLRPRPGMVFGGGNLVCAIQTFGSPSTNCVIPLPMVAPLPPSIPLRSLRSLRLKILRRQGTTAIRAEQRLSTGLGSIGRRGRLRSARTPTLRSAKRTTR